MILHSHCFRWDPRTCWLLNTSSATASKTKHNDKNGKIQNGIEWLNHAKSLPLQLSPFVTMFTVSIPSSWFLHSDHQSPVDIRWYMLKLIPYSYYVVLCPSLKPVETAAKCCARPCSCWWNWKSNCTQTSQCRGQLQRVVLKNWYHSCGQTVGFFILFAVWKSSLSFG